MRKIQTWACLIALIGVTACGSDEAENDSRAASTTVPGVITAKPVTTSGDHDFGGLDAPTPTSGSGSMAAAARPASPAFGTPAAMASSSGASTPVPSAPSSALPPSSAPLPPTMTMGPAITPQPAVQSGTLTAGTWDDNRNFDRFMSYRSKQLQSGRRGIMPLTDEEHNDAHDAFKDVHDGRQKLDVSLVIDTTGSMSDEIRYLQTEFLALSRAIEEDYPDAEQRWSLVVYRDVGDVYVSRVFDFRDDMNDFRDRLSEQFADGGGDFPEAPDAAFEAMNELEWRGDDNVARLAFWVADAPHHDANAEAMADALRETRGLDVHVYPVASSGIDEFTELTMRSAAQFTGGRYLFLTNDSGVGGDHKEPSIPCYFVTRLDQAILRMVRIELSGEYSEPAADQVVRRGGNPQSGSCKLESGDVVEVF